MREFTNVLTYMISLCEDNFDLKHKLEKVYEDSSFTAVFTDMGITECAWEAHDGQQPD